MKGQQKKLFFQPKEKYNPHPFLLLRPGVNNNFQPWRIHATGLFRKEFGDLATVWDTLVPHVEPAILATDFMPVIAPPGIDADGNVIPALPDLLPEQIAVLRLKAEEKRNGRIEKHRSNWKGLYELTMSTISTESELEIAAHADYAA
jgi:hypothetical protein